MTLLDLPESSPATLTATVWGVFQVKAQQELFITHALRAQGLDVRCPAILSRRFHGRRTVEIPVAVYQTYIFGCWSRDEDRAAIRHAKHVIGYLPVYSHEQAALAKQLASLELALAADPYLDVDDWRREGVRVKIKRGPMKGVEGQIIQRRGRAVLLVGVEMLGRVVEVNVDPLDVEPL